MPLVCAQRATDYDAPAPSPHKTDGTLNVAASLNAGVNCMPMAIETCTRNTPRYRGEDNFTAQRRKLASARAASVPLTRAMEARRALGRTKSVAKDV